MALCSPDLLTELLDASKSWEWILFNEFHLSEHQSSNTIFEQEVAASRRQANEEALLQAQHRRAEFLRSAAAQFVVPAPYSITYWLRDPKVIRKVYRGPGAQKKFDYIPTRPKFLRRSLGQPRPKAAVRPKAASSKSVRHQAKVTEAMALARSLGML